MLPNFLQRALAHPLRLAAFATLTLALAGCGGGGGSPGNTGNNPTTPENPTGAKPASVMLSSAATTISGSGLDGTEVELTAVVKDSGNNAIAGATVTFNASSGTVSSTQRVTDANGQVKEKLSVRGDSSPRAITITAGAGTATSAPVTVNVVAVPVTTPKIVMTAAAGTLLSAGADDASVAVRALILDSNNAVLPNTAVTFSTDSGSLSSSAGVTDEKGVAVVNLNTARDPATRVISVTGTAKGVTGVVKVNVVGTKLVLNAAPTVTAGASTDLTAIVTDSSGKAITDAPVTFAATSGQISVKGGGASPARTDSTGKVVLTYSSTTDGTDTVTVSALGESARAEIKTVSTNFTVAVVKEETVNGVLTRVPQTSANTGACHMVLVRDFNGSTARTGNITVSASRGAVFADAGCTVALNAEKALVNGEAIVYVKAPSPGPATLTANSSGSSSSVQGNVEFVSPLVSTAVISVQASPAVIGANAVGSTAEQSVVRAVVLDKAVGGNPVKNARVAFSIISDPSGGALAQPSEVITAADGSATVSYISGATPTATDGVKIEARIVSPVSNASSTTQLTVGKRSLSITAGTGNFIKDLSASTYQIEYTVFVTDAAGNPVSDAVVTASVRPSHYKKGERRFVIASPSRWVTDVTATCINEDLDSNGVLSTDEDSVLLSGNGNGRLDPGTPLNITPTVRTGPNGTAVVLLTYPKDRAHWLDVNFTIRGQVSGSEAVYVGYTNLPILGDDIDDANVTPPGVLSPYGKASSCSNPN